MSFFGVLCSGLKLLILGVGGWFAVRRWGSKLGFGVRGLVLGIFSGLAFITVCEGQFCRGYPGLCIVAAPRRSLRGMCPMFGKYMLLLMGPKNTR